MLPGAVYGRHVVQLSAGDCVLFATDGLHESRNGEGIEFYTAELKGVWAQCRPKTASGSADFAFGSQSAFSQWQRAPRRYYCGRAESADLAHVWCELSQIVDSHLLFQIRNLIDYLEEPFVAKEFVFFLFELFPQRIVLVWGYD